MKYCRWFLCYAVIFTVAAGRLPAAAAVYNPDAVIPATQPAVTKEEHGNAVPLIRLNLQRPTIKGNGTPITWLHSGQSYHLQVVARKADARLLDASGNLIWQDFHSVGGILSPHDLNYIQNSGGYRLEVTDRVNGARGEIAWCVLPPTGEVVADGMVGVSGGEWCPNLLTASGVTWRRRINGLGDTRYPNVFKNDKLDIDALRKAKDFERELHINALGCLWAPIKAEQLSDAGFPAWKKWWIESYVLPLVRATHEHIRYWEIYNEPYNVFGGEPQKYFELLKETAAALHQVDPDLQVVGMCGPSDLGGERFYREVLRLGAVEYMDVMSLHMPCWSSQPAANPEKRFGVWFATLKNMLQECGRSDIPIWNTETAVAPASTLYEFPENRRNITALQTIPPAKDQAVVAARVAIMHYVWDVKMFFQFYRPGIYYGVSPFEFDGTPTPAVAALAATRNMLEDGVYVGNPELHSRLNFYLFRCSETLVTAVAWLNQLRAGEKAELALVKELRRNRLFDMYGNPGSENLTNLVFTGEPIYLNISGRLSDAELMQALRNSGLMIGNDAKVDISLIPGAKAANAADWARFVPIDIGPVVDCGFSDDVAGGRERDFPLYDGPCDFRLLPPGDLLINQVPFRVLDPASNEQFAALALRGSGKYFLPPELKGIETGTDKPLSKIHLLWCCLQGNRSKPGAALAAVVLNYADGQTERIELKNREDVADYQEIKAPSAAKIGLQVPSSCRDCVTLFHKEIKLKRLAVVKTIDLQGLDVAIPVIVSITGELVQ